MTNGSASPEYGSAFTLPIELWRQIFEHAVHIPGLLDTTSDDREKVESNGVDAPIWKGWPTIEELRDRAPSSVATRRALVQVSSLWRDVATEFIYEAVAIWHPIDAIELLESMKGDDEKDSHSRRGWWIKRIDVADARNWDIDTWREIFIRCHNLHIVKFHHPIFDSLLPIICKQCPDTLKRTALHFEPTLKTAAPDFLYGATPAALDITVDWTSDHQILPMILRLDESFFENISSLTVLIFEAAFSTFPVHFRSLRRLSITVIDDDSFMFIGTFVAAHAPTLTSFYLHADDIIGNLTVDLSACQRLRDVAIYHIDLSNLSTDSALPSIERLSVEMGARSDLEVVADDLSDRISNNIFPKLRLILIGDIDVGEVGLLASLNSVCTGREIKLVIRSVEMEEITLTPE